MPLPKIHPLRKTYIDLRRCSIRLEQFIASEIGHDHDDYDFYLKLQELIAQAMDTIPEDHI